MKDSVNVGIHKRTLRDEREENIITITRIYRLSHTRRTNEITFTFEKSALASFINEYHEK